MSFPSKAVHWCIHSPCAGPFMIWHWKIALILSSSIKANFSQMNSNAVSLLFQLGSILQSDKKFWYRERKILLWSIKVNISSRKAILQNISIHKYFARCQICGYKFWKWPPKYLFPTTICFIFGDWCTFKSSHLSFRIIMVLMSFKYYQWCWLSEWKYWLKSLGISWNLDQTGKAFKIVMFVDEAGHE